MSSIFENIIDSISQREETDWLDLCMSLSKDMKRIPLRYRIIALGFVRNMSLGELNKKLISAGCEKLYARNFLEAGLIYAFSNRMSYERWKELQGFCSQLCAGAESENRYFQNRNISYADLREYVTSNSREEYQELHTRQVTFLLGSQLESLPDDAEQFRLFMIQNISEFSEVREKTRYYFCKYLYYYLRERINRYLDALRTGHGKREALAELLFLRGISAFKRKEPSVEEARALLEQFSVSCGSIYDEFNYFFFEYTSNDWMEVLLDGYESDLTKLPEEKRRRLAASIRVYHPEWQHEEDAVILAHKMRELKEEEREKDRISELYGNKMEYQKARSGEKSVRRYIKGVRDIDRTTLLCYLIFFGYDIHVDTDQMINRERLDQILRECGFPELGKIKKGKGTEKAAETDDFFLHYLDSDDPGQYLMEAVTECAVQNRNFFLYHMYNGSVNRTDELKRIMKNE